MRRASSPIRVWVEAQDEASEDGNVSADVDLSALYDVVELVPVPHEVQQDSRMSGENNIRLDGVSPPHVKPLMINLEPELLPSEAES